MLGRMFSTGRRQAVSPASPNDAAINLSIVRRDELLTISSAVDGKLVVHPLLELGCAGEFVRDSASIPCRSSLRDLDQGIVHSVG